MFIPSKASAQVQMPGSECQPANLTQALSLGLGWSQFGVTNNAPIGASGFFVACPVNVDDLAATYSDIQINVVFLDPAAQTVSCTLFAVFGNSQVFGTAMFSPITNPGAPYPNNAMINLGGLIPGSLAYVDAFSVICALPPQTRIGDILIF